MAEYPQYIVYDADCDSMVGEGGITQAEAIASAEKEIDANGDPDHGYTLGLYKRAGELEPMASKVKLKKIS